jgi:hypothetical protein
MTDDSIAKTIYLHCSCHTFEHSLRVSHWKDDPETLFIETIASPATLFRRAWLALKWVLGFEVVFGETVLKRQDAQALQTHLDDFFNLDGLVSDKARPIYEWCLKYDQRFKDNHDALLAHLIESGTERLYEESLKNAEPLPSEVEEALREASKKALETAVEADEEADEEEMW